MRSRLKSFEGMPYDPAFLLLHYVFSAVWHFDNSRSILFITGAGISADSGLPTFRGSGGLYGLDTTEDGLPVQRALAGDIMRDYPELTWRYLAQMEQTWRGACHNRAHEVIAEMERHFERVWTVTRNVDGFHRSAGAHNVIDIHGDLHDLRCMRCRHRPRCHLATLPPTRPRLLTGFLLCE